MSKSLIFAKFLVIIEWDLSLSAKIGLEKIPQRQTKSLLGITEFLDSQ